VYFVLIPPVLILNEVSLRTTSCSGLDRGGGGRDGGGLSLLGGGGSLSELGLLSGLRKGSLLGSTLSLSLGLSGGRILGLGLHGLAGLAEKATQLVALRLRLALGLIVGVTLLLAEVTEERGATLVLGGLSSGGRRGDVLGGLSFSGSSHTLGLNGLHGSLLDGVVELRSSAGNSGGLRRSASLLLSLLVRRAGNLLEKVAEERGALGLGLSLLLFLLFFLNLVLLLVVLLLDRLDRLDRSDRGCNTISFRRS
jgi:hypothetical protein